MQDKGPSRKQILGFRIIAVVAAILVWIMIKNTDDPVTSRRITGIPITFENTEVFTDNGLTYDVEGNITTATVIVYARSSNIDRISADDFEASVDFNRITDINGAVAVDVRYVGDEHLLENYTVVTNTLRITSESVTTQAMDVRVTTEGILADGLSVGNIEIDPATVYVSGPVSILNSIYSVGAVVDVTDAVDLVETDIELNFYDIRGQEIDLGSLSDEVSVTNGTEEVSTAHVRIEILSAAGATLEFRVTGADAVAEGFRYVGVSASRDSIVVLGNAETVAGIHSITISSPELDVTGVNSDVVKQINLNDYLPTGVRIDGDTMVTVTLNIEELVTNTFEIEAADIAVTGTDHAAFEYEVLENASLSLVGIADELSELDISEVNASVNVAGLTAGEHSVPVELILPEGIEEEEAVSVTVRITERETAAESGGDGSAAG